MDMHTLRNFFQILLSWVLDLVVFESVNGRINPTQVLKQKSSALFRV
jgi:hypothetical protein